MSNQNELLALHGQLIAGDGRASSKIAERVLVPLVRIVSQKVAGLHDVQDAEQACCDAVLDYLGNPGSFDPQRAGLLTYLAAIAVGKARTLRRSQTRRSGYEGKYAALVGEANEPPEDASEDAVLHRLDWGKFGKELIKEPGDELIVNLMKQSAHSPAAVASGLGLARGQTGLAEAAKRIERIRGRARRLAEKNEV